MQWFRKVQFKNIGIYMPSLEPISIIDDEWKMFGISIKEKRLTFQDPCARGKILSHQVKRWRPEKNQVKSEKEGEKGLITGIKVHSKAMHTLCQILYYLSFGFINKSIAVVIDDRTIYLNAGSLQKWRRLNHEALLSLGILKSPSNRKELPRVRQEELTALIQILRLPFNDRPQMKKLIRECSDSFELTATAFALAQTKVEACKLKNPDPEKLKEATFAIAAFYILLSSEIVVPACGQTFLQVGDRVNAQNYAASGEKLARLVEAGHENLKNTIAELERKAKELESQGQDVGVAKRQEKEARLDLELFESIRVVYETTPEGVVRRFFNKTPDLFSSLQTRNNPIRAKQLLNELFTDNENFVLGFTDKLLNIIVKDKAMPSSSKQQELIQHVLSLGNALKDQFTFSDPGLLLKNALQNSFVKLTSIMTEDNQDDLQMMYRIGTTTTWNLLKSSPSISYQADGSKTVTCTVEEPHIFSMHFPKQFYDNQECTQSSLLPFVNALSGRLACDDQITPACFQEAYEVARDIKELFAEEIILLEELVNRQTMNPLEGEKGHKTPETIIEEIKQELQPARRPSEFHKNFHSARDHRLSEYDQSYLVSDSIDGFENLIALYNKLEKLGKLVHHRYLSRHINGFLNMIDFEGGKIKINPELLEAVPLIKRTPEEHRKITRQYFPEYSIPQLPKKQPPQFKPKEHLKPQVGLDYLSYLFRELTNRSGQAAAGSCCVGALAQGIFNDIYASGNVNYITAIRNAASQYIKNHPEQFFDTVFEEGSYYRRDDDISRLSLIKNPTEKEKNELKRLQIKKVMKYANSLTGTEYFTIAAIKAISLIIGRPIYIADQGSSRALLRVDGNGHIEMQKINPHLDGEILYLHLKGAHYDCLQPLRVGTVDI